MKYNAKHKILFKVSPPAPWNDLLGIRYIYEEFGYSTPYNEEYHDVAFTFNGSNYNALLKYLKMK